MKRSTGSASAMALILCLSAASSAHATALVAIRVPTGVVIVADSRVVTGDLAVAGETCKIRTVGRWAFAAHGMAAAPGTGFDVFDSVVKRLRGESLADTAHQIASDLVAALTTALERQRRKEPSVFVKTVRRGQVSGVVIARVEAGVPELAYVEVHAALAADGHLTIGSVTHLCPSAGCPEGVAILTVPTGESIGVLPNEDLIADPVAPALRFVEARIHEGRPDIGGPIDVLRVASGKPSWVRRKPACVE